MRIYARQTSPLCRRCTLLCKQGPYRITAWHWINILTSAEFTGHVSMGVPWPCWSLKQTPVRACGVVLIIATSTCSCYAFVIACDWFMWLIHEMNSCPRLPPTTAFCTIQNQCSSEQKKTSVSIFAQLQNSFCVLFKIKSDEQARRVTVVKTA